VDEQRLVLVAAMVAVAWLATACVDSRCTRNAECPAGQVCNTLTGACAVPACTSDGECGDGRVCRQFACVAGCVVDTDCASDQRCFAGQCVARDQACDCAQAPHFCGVDLNPLSPTSGETVCVPDTFPTGVLLFFGSVLCPHCQDILDALEAMQVEVGGPGAAPMVFVQEPTIEVGASTVQEALAGATLAVLPDDPQAGIWPAYAADWYHVVLTNRNGCLDQHWGPLVPADVSDTRHAEMRAAWSAAAEAVCTPDPVEQVDLAPEVPEPTPEVVPEPDATVEPGPEARLEPAPEVVPGEASPEAAGEGTPEPAIEASSEGAFEPAVEVVDAPGPDGEAEAAPADVDAGGEPFQLADLCQVTAALPAVLGALVPHFLCKDVNTASAGFGGGFSDVALKEQVWIAYFGTCT